MRPNVKRAKAKKETTKEIKKFFNEIPPVEKAAEKITYYITFSSFTYEVWIRTELMYNEKIYGETSSYEEALKMQAEKQKELDFEAHMDMIAMLDEDYLYEIAVS